MQRDWEAQFRQWAKAPGQTEQDRCGNAVAAVRNAIAASEKLRGRDVTAFVQGSYRNHTNVRKDSDVDIGVLCKDTFFYDLPAGRTEQDFGIIPATYHYAQFKSEVGEALAKHFGPRAVSRGKKAFDVHETTYHVEADVAPFFEHRRYQPPGQELMGVELQTDDGTRVINWPEQHYRNGVEKNRATRTRYKAAVRILKALSGEMVDLAFAGADLPSFLIECLVWNVPNDHFQHDTYTGDIGAALVFLYKQTLNAEACNDWGEVSELKYLFRPSASSKRERANAFTVAAWNYAELGG